MNLNDFAFFFKSNIIRPLTTEESSYLLPIDKTITKKHDRALLLLHGFSSSPAVFRGMLPQFKGYDRIVCPVLPGHAESIQAFSTATVQDWRRVAEEQCAMLVESFKEVTVVGLSLGGVLALELSQHYKLQHLHLLAPALKLHYSAHWAWIAARCLHAVGWQSLQNAGGDIYTAHYQELTYRRLPLTTIIEMLALVDAPKSLQLTCPTDVFLGTHDKVADSKAIAPLFEHQKQATLHWLQHSAHILPLDGDMEIIVQTINNN
ncbi:MAG: alpha/beta fold hydrolase [Gammaproteobacteria bacterium]|nr:alpha/beta fold hydrolase [Gammaproteobacteria bacterium]